MESQFALRRERLKALREERGWSQRELARRCGFGESQVRKYENGESDPSSTYLKLMGDQLDVSTDYLLGGSDNPRGQFGDGQLDEAERIIVNIYRHEGWTGVIRLGAEKLSR